MPRTAEPSRRRRHARIEPADAPAPLWRGLEGGRFHPLSEPEITAVHRAVLDLLENLGLTQASASMIERVCQHGGRLTDDRRLLFPRALVEESIASARRQIVLHGQRPGLEIDLGGTRVHTSSGGAAPSILDADSGRYRPSTTEDLYAAARLVDALDNIHHFSRSLVAGDAPDNFSLDVNTAYACLAGTAKPVSISVCDVSHVAAIADLCYRIAGGESRFRQAPFLTVMVCHVVPPMRFATDACHSLEAAILAGFPVQIISDQPDGRDQPEDPYRIIDSGDHRDARLSGVCPALFSGGSIPAILKSIGTLISAPFKVKGSSASTTAFTIRYLSLTMFPFLSSPSPLRLLSA